MTRRDCLTLGTALFSAACTPAKRTGYLGYALIATSGENSLAVVDLATFRLLKTVPLGAAPSAVIPATFSNQNYVLTPSNDNVHILDRNLSLTSSHRLGEGIAEIRLFPDRSALIVAACPSREIIQADPVSLRVVRRIKLDAEPSSLDVSANGFVAASTGPHGTVELLHPVSGLHKKIQIGGPVGDVRFRGDNQILLAARTDERSILAIDVATQQFVAELPLAMEPDHLCFNADQGQLFVTGKGMDGVAIVFPYKTMEVEQTVLAARNPGVMAASDAPEYLFIASANGSDVSILNIFTRKLIGVVDVGGQSEFIAITPDNRFALVLNKTSGTMAVIHIPTIRATREKKGVSLFALVDVGAKPVHVAVVAREA
jgi:DNA-binding beta-propeller fold protein YncE